MTITNTCIGIFENCPVHPVHLLKFVCVVAAFCTCKVVVLPISTYCIFDILVDVMITFAYALHCFPVLPGSFLN